MMASITITEIKKPVDCRYMTIEECMAANGERHRLNGERYLAAGNPEYAEGSFIKAYKNFAKAREFSRIFRSSNA